jgi:hypothetical protein
MRGDTVAENPCTVMINVPKKSSQAWFVLVLWERLSIYDPFSPVTVPHFPETAEGKKLGLPSHRSFADPANSGWRLVTQILDH